MDELLFIETIRVEDGTFVRPELHLQRMRQTVREAYGVASGFDLADGSIPLQHRKGTVKCRIVYGRSLSEISFAPYVPREIRSLRLVAADDELDYHLKYADRSALARLLQRRDDCDEILIVRDGAITDTSYSNVAFFDGYFPAQRHAEAVLARYGSFNRMPHYAFRPGRFRAGRAHQCHVGNRGRPRRSDRTDSGIITEGKWHNRRVADPAFFIDQIRPLAGFSGMSALSFVIGDPVATDFFRDVAHEFEARDQGVDVGLGNDEILVVAGLYIGIL